MPRTRAPASVLTTLAVGAMVVGSTPTPTSAANTTRKVNAAAPGAKSKAAASTFKAEVWADNWFTMSVNGTKVGEDSVPITTERSFNAETFTFRASYPLTIAIETKDFKETDSGIEYIGKGQQQMGVGNVHQYLAEVYGAQGRYGDAEDLHRRSVAIREQSLGLEHPDVAESLNNLAELYRSTNVGVAPLGTDGTGPAAPPILMNVISD